MKAIEKGGKAFLLRTLAALAIMALCISPALTSLPAYADDGAAAAVAAPAVEAAPAAEAAPSAEATSVETDEATAAEAAPAAEADAGEAVAAAETTEVTIESIAGIAKAAVTESYVAATEAAVTTDQFDYQPGETVGIAADGFVPNAEVMLTLTNPDGSVTEWTATANENGAIDTSYELTDGIQGIYVLEASDGTSTASTVFTDPQMILRPDGSGAVTQLTGNWNWLGFSNWQHVNEGGGGDGDLSRVSTTANNWKVDLYSLQDPVVPSSGGDTTEPTDPTDIDTDHTLDAWSNEPMVYDGGGTRLPDIVWSGATDPGGEGSEATINFVKVWVKARTTDSSPDGGEQVVAGIVTEGGTDSASSAQSLSKSYVYYTYQLNTNPDDGDAWEWTDLDDLQAGLALKDDGSGWGNARSCATQLFVEVDYSGGEGAASGVAGYHYVWVAPGDTPPTDLADWNYIDHTGDPNQLFVDGGVPEGINDFYLCTIDNAGNHTNTIDLGTFMKDYTDPTVIKTLDGVNYGDSPPAWFNEADGDVTVVLQVQDALSGPDQAFYSYDGTNWYTYTGPLDLSEGIHDFYHKGTDIAGNESDPEFQTIRSDQTDPTVTKTLDGVDYDGSPPTWFNEADGDVTVVLQVQDALSGPDQAFYSYDGTNWYTYTGPLDLSEGIHDFYHKGTDIAGNESDPEFQTIRSDQTDPRLYKDLDGTEGNNGWYTSDVEASLWATDWSLSHETSGVKYIQYQVGDGGPVVQVPIPAEQPTTQGPAAYPEPDGLEWALYFAKMLAGVAPDEGLIPLDDETVEVLITQEGKTTLYHSAQDVAGNISDPDATPSSEDLGWDQYLVGDSQEIKIDKTAPQLYKLEFGDEGSYGWYASPVNVKLTATDPNSGWWWNPVESSGVDYITYQVDDNGWVTCDAPMGGWFRDADQGPQVWTCPPGWGFITVSGDGRHTLYHEAYDVAGNIHEKQGWFDVGYEQEVKIDTADPVLVKTLNGDLPQDAPDWFNQDVQVVLTATDYDPNIDTSGVRYIKYDILGDGNFPTTVWAPIVGDQGDTSAAGFSTQFVMSDEGIWYLKHQAQDVAGNTDPDGWFCWLDPQEVKIDKTDPTLVKDAVRTGTSEITVTLTGADALSGVDFIRYSTDGGASWTTVHSDTTSFTLTGIGDNHLGHLVFDIAGNDYVLADQVLSIEEPTTTGIAPASIEVNLMGTVASYLRSIDGVLLEDIEITSPDGLLTLRIPAGTVILSGDGSPASNLQILAATGVTAPDGYQLIGAYQFTPPGTTFAPDATLIVNYDPATVPEGMTPVVFYFDETAGAWVELEAAGYVAGGIVIPNTVISQIGSANTFAIFAH